MYDTGFYISLISPQGGAGVSTVSIGLGLKLSDEKFNTILISPGANYDYNFEIDLNHIYSLTKAYYLHSKGKSSNYINNCSSEDKVNKAEETPKAFEYIFKKLERSLDYQTKSNLSYCTSFNNFLEIDEITDELYINFIFEEFKSYDFVIIDTSRIPPFKLCGVLDCSNIVLVVIDCRDPLYLNKLEGFVKSIMKVNPYIKSNFFNKCFYILNHSGNNQEDLVGDTISNLIGVTDTKIFKIPMINNLYTFKSSNVKFNIRNLNKLDLNNLTKEIVSKRNEIINFEGGRGK